MIGAAARKGDTVESEENEDQEGWFTDPFGRHEARWLSWGKPTKLVRDEGIESYDEPPDQQPGEVAVRIEETPLAGGADLRRADDGAGDLADLDDRMGNAALEGGAHPMIDLP